jgi:hypothetical protein
MDWTAAVDGLNKLFELIANSPAGATLSVVGFILLICGVAMGRLALRSSPRNTPGWVKFALFGCLIGGVLFSSMGPTIALLSFASYAIEKVSTDKAFDNLETNERVRWLVRLIPYAPKDNPDLAIGRLKQLGPPNQAYTFVAAYDELVGYSVEDAVRMVGGAYNSEQRVSAIIFPLAQPQRLKLYPANARGLLQVIKLIEANTSNQIDKRLLDGGALDSTEVDDLSPREGEPLVDWRWQNYSSKYPHY